MLQVRTTASLANTPEAYARVSSQALKSGSSRRIIPSSVRKDLRRRRSLGALDGPADQLLHDLERGVQWIASALRQRNPDGLPITLEPRQDVWRWLVAGDTAITECDERVAQWCGEPARLAPVQKHERELGMFSAFAP